MTKRNTPPKLSKKKRLPVGKGTLESDGPRVNGCGDKSATSSIVALEKLRQSRKQFRESGVPLPISSRTSPDPGNNHKRTKTTTRTTMFSYNTSLSKYTNSEGANGIVQNENEKVKFWWIAILGVVLSRMRNAFVARKQLYAALGIFVILFSFSILPLSVSAFSPAPILLFDPISGIPDGLFVSEDGSGPNITNVQATFIETGMFIKIPNTLRISWQTDVPANSIVEYATRTQYLAASSSNAYPFVGFV